jgi:hypothetical protein
MSDLSQSMGAFELAARVDMAAQQVCLLVVAVAVVCLGSNPPPRPQALLPLLPYTQTRLAQRVERCRIQRSVLASQAAVLGASQQLPLALARVRAWWSYYRVLTPALVGAPRVGGAQQQRL